MDSKAKAKQLFHQAVDLYQNKKYEEALKLFLSSYNLDNKESTEIYINRCKKFLNQTNPTSNQNTNDNVEKDRECKAIIEKKDPYDILGVTRNSTENEIKKSYRKLAVKFHPDKNQSRFAGDAFKKISHAFSILGDKEKKEKFDRYGTEDEVRGPNFHGFNGHFNFDDEMDPFDLFEMFFSGGQRRQGQNGHFFHFQRPQNQRRANNPPNQNQQRGGIFNLSIFQLLPIILIFFFYIVPYFTAPEIKLYSFVKGDVYYRKQLTETNKLPYYVGDSYLEKIKSLNERKKLDNQIEFDYKEYQRVNCAKYYEKRRELEYKISYYNSYYKTKFTEELNNLDYSHCNIYEKIKNKIR